MKRKPILFLILAIVILIVPTIVYLCFLVPQMSERYNILMASGGCVGGLGLYGSSKIPEKVKYSSLFKLAGRSFTLLTVTTLVEEFIIKIIGLIAVLIVSYIIYKILMGVYKDAKQRKQNAELAKEISRSLDKDTE